MELNSFFTNKINLLYDCINYTYEHGLNNEIIEKILKSFLLNEKMLANYIILQEDVNAFYNLENNCIFCSQRTIENNSKIRLYHMRKDYNIFEEDKLLIYLQFFTILHEVMHVYQWKKSEIFFLNYIDDKQMIKNLYDYYTKFIQSGNSKYILYKKNQHRYFIERSASLEALNILEKVSELEKEDFIKSYMSCLILSFEYLGYEKNQLGSIYETYTKTKQRKVFNKIYEEIELPLLQKIRYGLPLSIEEYDMYFQWIEDIENKNSKVLKLMK